MESHADEYEFSNIKKIESKINAALADANKEDIRMKLESEDKGDGSVQGWKYQELRPDTQILLWYLTLRSDLTLKFDLEDRPWYSTLWSDLEI